MAAILVAIRKVTKMAGKNKIKYKVWISIVSFLTIV